MGTATCYILHALYGTLIICLRTSHFLQEFEQVGRLNSYRDKQVVHVQCRLSVSYLRAKLLLSGSQRILFFSEKDRSLKRFYGKLILAVSDRARWAHRCAPGSSSRWFVAIRPRSLHFPIMTHTIYSKGRAKVVIHVPYRYYAETIAVHILAKIKSKISNKIILK